MKLNPYLQVIIAATIAGSGGIFIKSLEMSSFSISFFRTAIPTILVLLILRYRQIKLASANKSILLASFFNALKYVCVFSAFIYTEISNAIIAFYIWPIISVILGIIFLKEKIHKKNIIWLILSFLGLVLVYFDIEINFSNKDFLGISLAILGAIFFSWHLIIFKKYSPKYSLYENIFYQNIVGAIIFLPFIFLSGNNYNFTNIAIVVLFSIIMGMMVYGLFLNAIGKVKISVFSILCYLEIVSAIIFGIIFFNESLTWNMILGGSLIIISAIFLKRE